MGYYYYFELLNMDLKIFSVVDFEDNYYIVVVQSHYNLYLNLVEMYLYYYYLLLEELLLIHYFEMDFGY